VGGVLYHVQFAGIFKHFTICLHQPEFVYFLLNLLSTNSLYFFQFDTIMIEDKVKEKFGVQLRPFQVTALQSLLNKKDVFVAVPTGKYGIVLLCNMVSLSNLNF